MATRGGSNDVGFKKWKGIVTEQNIGQYEAEAAIDADNVEFLQDGTILRRLGLALEPSEVEGVAIPALVYLDDAQRQGAAFSTFLWEDINGIPGASLRAIQAGSIIKLVEDTSPVNDAVLLATINLEGYASGAVAEVERAPCAFAAGAGVMLIVASGIEPIRVTVDTNQSPMAVTFSQQVIGIRWDRLEGENTGSGLGPTSLTAGHEFDLRNSGWPFRADCAGRQDGGDAVFIKTDPAAYFKAKNGVWPKVSIMFSALRLSNTTEPAVLGGFSPWEADKIHFGNTIPPKGHYITSAWFFDSRALMQDDIGGAPVGVDPRWVLQYWQVTGVDVNANQQRFTAEPIIHFVGTFAGGSFKGALSFAQSKASPPVGEFTAAASGQLRITWSTGFNAGPSTVGGVGNGRGDFALDGKAAFAIGIGDRFNLS